MTENIKKIDKIDNPKDDIVREHDASGASVFLFPSEGISITADSLEDAQKIYEKTLKQNKESDNG